MNELQDVRVTAGSFNFLLGNLFSGFDSTEEDVEFDSAGVKRGFLGHKSEMFSVFLNIQFGNSVPIELSGVTKAQLTLQDHY